MALWEVYGCKSDCEDAPPLEVEHITAVLRARYIKQQEDEDKQENKTTRDAMVARQFGKA